jgi:hypothetical protein
MNNDAIKLGALFTAIVTLGSTPLILSAATEWWLANQWAFYCSSHAAEPICVALF